MSGWSATGTLLGQVSANMRLAEAYRLAHRPMDGVNLLNDTLGIIQRSGDHFDEAELYRIKGELLRQHSQGSIDDKYTTEVERSFLKQLRLPKSSKPNCGNCVRPSA